jgi:hypothetical protein
VIRSYGLIQHLFVCDKKLAGSAIKHVIEPLARFRRRIRQQRPVCSSRSPTTAENRNRLAFGCRIEVASQDHRMKGGAKQFIERRRLLDTELGLLVMQVCGHKRQGLIINDHAGFNGDSALSLGSSREPGMFPRRRSWPDGQRGTCQ